jgi:hypothetical protein
MDFAKLVEVFDRHQVTFVSVTQAFNTTTSMGRLTLNVLLSFAQFEREVTGERIRDKIAASRAKGMWMGGFVPLGYDVLDRKLVINPSEAANVRHLFERFVELESATKLAREVVQQGIRNKRGRAIDKGFLYKLFRNRVYLGEAVHKGTSYPGEQEAIIDQPLWDKVHAILEVNFRQRAMKTRAQTPYLLKGLMFTDTGVAMTPSHTRKGDRLYRYYISMDAIHNRAGENGPLPRRLNAGMVEGVVIQELRRLLATPAIKAHAIKAARQSQPDIDENDVISALTQFESLWETLFPAEQARIAKLLIRRVTVNDNGLAVDLRTDGLGPIVHDMLGPRKAA